PAPPRTRGTRVRSSRRGRGTPGRRDVHVVREQRHRVALARTRRLVHDHLQPRELIADLLGRQEMGACRQDRSLEHGVARPVEAEELAPEPPVRYDGHDARARRGGVKRVHLDLSPGARRLEHDAADGGRRDRRELDGGDRALREQHDVVRQVHDGRPGVAEILERRGLEKRLDDDLLLAPFDAHRREVGRPGGIEGRENRLDDHRTNSAGGGGGGAIPGARSGSRGAGGGGGGGARAPSARSGSQAVRAVAPWRKRSSRRYPCAVSTGSGWNWRPGTGWRTCETAI